MACQPCLQLKQEFSSPMFDLSEPMLSPNKNKNDIKSINKSSLISNSAGNDNVQLDVVETISPTSPLSRKFTILLKFLLLGWVASITAQSILNSDYPFFWMAYLTHWGWVVTNAYFVGSFLGAVVLSCRPGWGYAGGKEDGGEAGWIVKVIWALYSMALPIEVVITILFWLLEFDGTLRYVSIMVHGGGVVLLLFDGVVLNRLPIRCKQFFLFETFAALYLIWSVSHAHFGIGNPYRGDLDENGEVIDDDAIYGSLKWNVNFKAAVIITAATLLLVNPIVFFVCRGLSRMLPLRGIRKGGGAKGGAKIELSMLNEV